MEKSVAKKKKTSRVIIIIILFIIGCCGFYIYHKENQIKAMKSQIESRLLNTNLKYRVVAEYGSEWDYNDFLASLIDDNLYNGTKVTFVIANQEFGSFDKYQFMEVTELKVKIKLSKSYRYKLFTEKEEIIQEEKIAVIEVQDSKPPIIEGVSNQEIIEGDSLDLKKGIKAYDEVDGELDFTILGDVDTNKAGSYPVKVVAIDKNKNKSEKEFTVVVKAKVVVEKPSSNTTNPNNSKPNNNSGSNNSTPMTDKTKEGRLNLAKLEAKKVISQIITDDMSDYQKAEAIFEYLNNNVETQLNQSSEAYKTNFGNEAYAALVLKIAACSGFCKAVTLLCDEAHLQSQHINKDLWTHQWNLVLIDGKWIVLDAQGGIFGGEKHPLEY